MVRRSRGRGEGLVLWKEKGVEETEEETLQDTDLSGSVCWLRSKAKATFYVGCDTADVSLQSSLKRYNELPKVTFPATLLCGDCFEVTLSDYLPDDVQFDIVSCQFAIHYAFENEKRIRKMLENVTDRLKPGGFVIGTTPDANVLVRKLRAIPQGLEFGNSIFTVVFDGPSTAFPAGPSQESQLSHVLGQPRPTSSPPPPPPPPPCFAPNSGTLSSDVTAP